MNSHVLPQKKVFQIAEETGCSALEVLPYPAPDDKDDERARYEFQIRSK